MQNKIRHYNILLSISNIIFSIYYICFLFVAVIPIILLFLSFYYLFTNGFGFMNGMLSFLIILLIPAIFLSGFLIVTLFKIWKHSLQLQTSQKKFFVLNALKTDVRTKLLPICLFVGISSGFILELYFQYSKQLNFGIYDIIFKIIFIFNFIAVIFHIYYNSSVSKIKTSYQMKNILNK